MIIQKLQTLFTGDKMYKVEITGVDTSKLEALSFEETNKLIKEAHDGSIDARDKIIKGNLKLILSVIKRFSYKKENNDDLFQVGTIGLMKAIDNFDLSHNVKFSTYAVPMIDGEVKRCLRDNNSIRISRSTKDIAYKVIKLKDELTSKNGVEPSNEEIAKMLDLKEIEIILALDSLKEPVSMHEPIYNDGGDTIYLQDQLEDKKDNINSWDISIYLKDALNKIPNKEKRILIDRYLMGKTQVEISEEIGISQAQVSRLEKNAIKDVKKLIK